MAAGLAYIKGWGVLSRRTVAIAPTWCNPPDLDSNWFDPTRYKLTQRVGFSLKARRPDVAPAHVWRGGLPGPWTLPPSPPSRRLQLVYSTPCSSCSRCCSSSLPRAMPSCSTNLSMHTNKDLGSKQFSLTKYSDSIRSEFTCCSNSFAGALVIGPILISSLDFFAATW